jgi:UDP-N-acetylmuramate: L-alanyl-gamma-D-glutamyl-meso-diaminopimelate ligase
MRIHFIAIGGAAMHNLAIALLAKGYHITGSDDEIFEPSRSRLENVGLLPEKFGWFPEKLNTKIDAVILGMHALENNPELLRARELDLKIYSYPEFLFEQTKHKKRVVIGGSHGKTTITSMVMHVLKYKDVKFDYMVGAQIEGFETMVSLLDDTNLAVFEGDEYLSSPIDKRPKFHLYKPHIALISGIGWDHINVFPTFENYLEQFRLFINKIEPDGQLYYYKEDVNIANILKSNKRTDLFCEVYSLPNYEIIQGKTFLITETGIKIPLEIFGDHNLQNLSGAMKICNAIGITAEDFYFAISSFKGSAKRLQLFYANEDKKLFIDFAHSPSKLKGSINAVCKQFPESEIIAVFELHTFSSLSKEFLREYSGSIDGADKAIVFYNPEVVSHKNLPDLTPNDIFEAFDYNSVQVIDNTEILKETIRKTSSKKQQVYLFMSSGNFGGLKLNDLKELINH